MFFNRKKAVLLIHGIAGGTYDFENLFFDLVPCRKLDVFEFTLPGHDEHFASAIRKDWIESTCTHIEKIIELGYKEIYLVGHSMGGVIAAIVAPKYNEVKKIVFAAAAFKYLKITNDSLDVVKSIKSAPNIIKTYKFSTIISRIFKANGKGLKEFMKLVSENEDSVSKITQPVLIIQGDKDDFVPVLSSKYIYDNVKSEYKKMIIFKGETHDLFRGKKIKEITNEIKKFLVKNVMFSDEIINM